MDCLSSRSKFLLIKKIITDVSKWRFKRRILLYSLIPDEKGSEKQENTFKNGRYGAFGGGQAVAKPEGD